jgi:hypothetical protein
MVFARTPHPHGKEAFQVAKSTRSGRLCPRPRTKKVRRHQNQPILWPDADRPSPPLRRRQVNVKLYERGDMTSYGGLNLAHELVSRLCLDQLINGLRVSDEYYGKDGFKTQYVKYYASPRHHDGIDRHWWFDRGRPIKYVESGKVVFDVSGSKQPVSEE